MASLDGRLIVVRMFGQNPRFGWFGRASENAGRRVSLGINLERAETGHRACGGRTSLFASGHSGMVKG